MEDLLAVSERCADGLGGDELSLCPPIQNDPGPVRPGC